jgi:hypothetical protein
MCCNQFAQTPLPGIIMKLKIVLSFFGVAKAGKTQTKKICTIDLQIAAGSSTSLIISQSSLLPQTMIHMSS